MLTKIKFTLDVVGGLMIIGIVMVFSIHGWLVD